ncbi:MAG: hypothetical protein EA359_08155 [Balneolaceae bacterium]|nr:MAG: hypothetical protein EA359_08155 [Balneolaceae bacterium]
MKRKTIINLSVIFAVVMGTMACGTSLVIQDVDYSQPLESVLTPDADNRVHDQRYAIKFSIIPVLQEEGITSVDEIRVIRNRAGYYFITASGFSHVYVFEPDESVLKLKNKIEIAGEGLGQPAFNQRNTHIELVDMISGQSYNIDQNGRR